MLQGKITNSKDAVKVLCDSIRKATQENLSEILAELKTLQGKMHKL